MKGGNQLPKMKLRHGCLNLNLLKINTMHRYMIMSMNLMRYSFSMIVTMSICVIKRDYFKTILASSKKKSNKLTRSRKPGMKLHIVLKEVWRRQ